MAGRDVEDEVGRAPKEHVCPRWPDECNGSPDCPLCGEASDVGRAFSLCQSLGVLALIALCVVAIVVLA